MLIVVILAATSAAAVDANVLVIVVLYKLLTAIIIHVFALLFLFGDFFVSCWEGFSRRFFFISFFSALHSIAMNQSVFHINEN